jgi:hypothetical protein
MKILFLLICGHALADFVLQSDDMAFGKARTQGLNLYDVPWYYWLTAHALIHGGIVCLITGSLLFAMIELFSHWLIDFFKSENKLSINEDQIIHIILKLFYAVMITGN